MDSENGPKSLNHCEGLLFSYRSDTLVLNSVIIQHEG